MMRHKLAGRSVAPVLVRDQKRALRVYRLPMYTDDALAGQVRRHARHNIATAFYGSGRTLGAKRLCRLDVQGFDTVDEDLLASSRAVAAFGVWTLRDLGDRRHRSCVTHPSC